MPDAAACRRRRRGGRRRSFLAGGTVHDAQATSGRDPFTSASTAAEVLAGIDLAGRNAIVTGGHAGIGLEVTRALAKAGASVTIGARDPDRAALVFGVTGRGEVGRLDLVDPRSIKAFAARWLKDGRPLQILVTVPAPPAERTKSFIGRQTTAESS